MHIPLLEWVNIYGQVVVIAAHSSAPLKSMRPAGMCPVTFIINITSVPVAPRGSEEND